LETRYYHDHGQCYTYRPPKGAAAPIPGVRDGYKVYFNYLPGNPNRNAMTPGGMDMYVHDPDEFWTENPLLASRGEHIFINSGLEAYVTISSTNYHHLDKPEDPCVDRNPSEESYTEVINDLINVSM